MNCFLQRRIFKYFLLIILITSIGACQKSSKLQHTWEKPSLYNDHWQFISSYEDLTLEKILRSTEWINVSLPHTPKIEPKIVNNQWQGFAWYRKKVTLQPSWKQKHIYIDFEAAMNVAEVWFNGKKVKTHLGGYLPFSVLLTDFNSDNENWLIVKLDNRDNRITGPKPLIELDFNTYGGLYRNVWLRIENPNHITDAVDANKVASGGVFVSYPKVDKQESIIQIKTHLLTPEKNITLQLQQQLYYNNQLIASNSTAVKANQTEQEITQELRLKNPALWSPQAPELYKLVTQLVNETGIVDQEEKKIGIREFRFIQNQLLINGEKTFLRGVNRHQEYPYIGYALSDAAQYRDAEKIKAAGFDYVRLSHYPHSKAFMAAADELGLVLVNSILGWQYVNESTEFEHHVVQTCRDLIRRDRNHPSVLAWECSLNESAMSNQLIDQFQQAVHEEMPYANTYSAGWKDYAYDIYLQARQHRLEHYQTPKKPYIVSEYGDWEYYAMNAGFQQNSWKDLLQADRSSRQLLSDGETRLQQQASNIIEAHNDNFNVPTFADGYWVMFDYNRGYADDIEASGIMSIDRSPKFSYYFFQSQRNASEYAGPLTSGYKVFMATHWTQASSLRIPIFTNAEKVKIYLNEHLVGETIVDPRHANLKHPVRYIQMKEFIAGKLRAVAYANNKIVASHQVMTPSSVEHVQVELDPSSVAPQANQNDVVFIRARLLDNHQNPVHLNQAKVQFNLEGDAEWVSPNLIETEDGVASALLKIGANLSSIKISASYQNIKSNSLALPGSHEAEK
jgi:beta-galactosidase